jgi:pSer/pThr/pTyr-binding forkhead associated (FHA) protein
LLHGDKVQIGPVELLFVDERRSGSTQYVEAVDPASLAQAKGRKGGSPTGTTGGRIVSLTDGREYAVTGQSLVIGRDASSDVVLTGKSVSRRHAEIMASPKGYVLVDNSTNGSWVNGERVKGQRILARGDVIKTGDDEFRFYADVAAAAPPAAAPPPPAPPTVPAHGAEQRLANTMFGMKVPPAAPPPAAAAPAATAARAPAGPLASLVGRTGAFKGQRYPIRVPVVNLGRAEYNDIVLVDDSVSTVHAKLQRREGVWVVVDLESTNGTFVDGERVEGEAPIAPGALLRFGGIGMLFESSDDTVDAAKGSSTKMIQAVKLPPKPRP